MKKYLFTILVMIIVFTFLYHGTPLFDSIKSDIDTESSTESETGDENNTPDEDQTPDDSVDLPPVEI